MPNAPPSYQPSEPSKRIEEARATEKTALEQAVNAEPVSEPATPKAKARTSRTRKPKRRSTTPKADVADRLPLNEPGNEVDVQFSSPATQPEEDKQ
jgi:hypothetical protein